MNFIKTPIEGVIIVEPRVFNDPRGYFLKATMQKSLKQMELIVTSYRIISQSLAMV